MAISAPRTFADVAKRNDSNLCTIFDPCQSHVWIGSALNCDDANGCTDDSCDPVNRCLHTANTVPCASRTCGNKKCGP